MCVCVCVTQSADGPRQPRYSDRKKCITSRHTNVNIRIFKYRSRNVVIQRKNPVTHIDPLPASTYQMSKTMNEYLCPKHSTKSLMNSKAKYQD